MLHYPTRQTAHRQAGGLSKARRKYRLPCQILYVENVSGGACAVAKLNKGFWGVVARCPIGGRVFRSNGFLNAL